MDFLDGSDVDDENGDVDQDVENVLLGSDDDEATVQHHTASKLSTYRGQQSREEEDVLNLGDEEELDYEVDDVGQDGSVSPVKQLNSVNPVRDEEDLRHTLEDRNLPSSSNYEANEDNFNFAERRFAEDDEYDDGDDEEENRNTRSRFTSERNVESLSGGHMSSSVGIPIQTVGDRKVRPGTPGENRPKHWGHNGPRPGGIRHPGRNQRFTPPRPGSYENSHRPGMNQPAVQFNDGLFTDFNQPIRHPHPHPRMRPPQPGRFEMPRNPELGTGRPIAPPQNMRPNFQPHHQRGGFVPHDNRFGPPRLPPHPAGNMNRPPHPFPQDFNARNQRPPRFPMNHPNQRGARPPHHVMNGPHTYPGDRPPFPPRQPNPHFRGEIPNQIGEMEPRMPNQPGFPQPSHPQHMQPDFVPHPTPNMNPPRFMGYPPRPPAPMNGPMNQYYPPEQQTPAVANYHALPEPHPNHFHHNGQWNNAPAPDPMSHHQGQWMQQQPHVPPQPPSQNYIPNPMYDPAVHVSANAMIPSHSHIIQQITPSHMPITLTASHALELPPISKSIYIKPNSEIHEALSKSQLRHHLKDDERRKYEDQSSKREHDDHYYRERDRGDRERSSSSRHERSYDRSDRRRDDDYYEDRRSYHDRRRRRHDDDDRRRSESPERKISRSERVSEMSIERRRENEEIERERKETEKLKAEAKKMGLGEDYVKKLEEQRKLRERILRNKEERRKQVKVATDSPTTDSSTSNNDQTKPSQAKEVGSKLNSSSKIASTSNSQKPGNEKAKEIEADSTVASGKSGKPKRILRIVRDKAGNVISKKVHVIVAKPQQDGPQ